MTYKHYDALIWRTKVTGFAAAAACVAFLAASYFFAVYGIPRDELFRQIAWLYGLAAILPGIATILMLWGYVVTKNNHEAGIDPPILLRQCQSLP